MTHKAQTSIIDFVSLLGSQCILSSILCQGRTPTSRNEFFVRSRARNCSINIKTPSPESTLNLEVVREDNSVEGPFLTLDFKSSLLRASRWNNFRVFSVGDKLLVFLEGGLLNERKTHSEETQLVIQQRQNWKKIKHDLVLYVFHSIYYRFGPNAPEINLLFSLPKVLDAPNKGACGVNPTSVDFSHNLHWDCELGGVVSANGKKQQISCDPDVLKGVNLCYDGLLRLKLFEYKFYWNSRKDWKRSVGRFDGGGKNTMWWMRHPSWRHRACAIGPVVNVHKAWQHSEPCSDSRERRYTRFLKNIYFFTRYCSTSWGNRCFNSYDGKWRV